MGVCNLKQKNDSRVPGKASQLPSGAAESHLKSQQNSLENSGYRKWVPSQLIGNPVEETRHPGHFSKMSKLLSST